MSKTACIVHDEELGAGPKATGVTVDTTAYEAVLTLENSVNPVLTGIDFCAEQSDSGAEVMTLKLTNKSGANIAFNDNPASEKLTATLAINGANPIATFILGPGGSAAVNWADGEVLTFTATQE